MATEPDKVERAESEQDEEEDVYEVERIIDMRVEEGEVLYRVRWKNYCSDDDTWEPEAHLEDCREVLLAFKKAMADAKAKKEAEAKKPVKVLPTKSDVFDADSESDSDKDPPTDAPMKKKKKKKKMKEEEEDEDEEPAQKEKKKKKKKDKWKEEFRPLPAPETDEDEVIPPSSPPKEKKLELKKRFIDSEEEEDDPVPSKKNKKEKGKDGGKYRKEKGEEGKKKKGKRDRKIETSDDEAAAPLEDNMSDGPSDSQMDDTASTETVPKSSEKQRLDDKSKQKKGKWEVKLQGIKDLIQDKKSKKPDTTQKLKSLTSKSKDEAAPHSSDSSDSSTLHKKAKSKGQESASVPPKASSSSTSSSLSSSSVTAGSSTKAKEDEVAKEEVLGQKDAKGSTNLFEKFLLTCEAKDLAPRRQPLHQPTVEKSSSKPVKIIGKIEKISKPSKDSPVQRQDSDKAKQSDAASRLGQSHGFSLDSDEREGEASAAKPRPGDDSRDRRERPEEAQRPSWERRTPVDDRRRRREDSEPRLFIACDDNQDAQDPLEGTNKSDKGQATLSLGMDLNLDWMTLDDFQKHLNGEDEILSGPPLSPSELRDAVKCGDYMAVKLALNSKEEYNLDQETSLKTLFTTLDHVCVHNKPRTLRGKKTEQVMGQNELKQECTIGEKRSFEGQRSLIEERRLTPNLNNARNEEGTQSVKEVILTDLNPQDGKKDPTGTNTEQEGRREHIEKEEKDIMGLEVLEQREEDNILDDTKTGASNPSTLMTEDNRTEEVKQSSCEEANYSNKEAEDVFAGPSDNKDELNLNDTNKTISQHRSKPVERILPTRSSQRTCRKVLETTQSNVCDEKRVPLKKHFCLYCKTAFIQLAKHLEKKHAEETDVAHAIHFPKGSKVRQTLLDQIRSKGDYEHNSRFLKKGEREVVTKKHVKNSNISVRDYLPCQHCFAFYRKTDLWRHECSCKAKKGDENSSELTKKDPSPPSDSSEPLSMSVFLTESCKEIINVMHQDDISQHIRNDPLICKYGNALSVKYAHDKSQFAYIAQKMRELGRFVLAVHELDSRVQYLHEICLPDRFELAVEGAKRAGGFDPSSSRFKTVSLISKIGYSLKRAAEIAFGESRMREDGETESEVKKFIQLLDTKWSECFSRKALTYSLKQDVKKVEVDKSTVTEDLIKLHRFIMGEEDDAMKELKDSPNISTWKKLSEATLADVCLFNRGRVGNIGRMLLQTYTSKKSTGEFMLSADQIRKSTQLELELGDTLTRLELEGQYGRNMLVLLTERMVSSIDLLVGNRQDAGVSKSNPYLFARTEGPSFVRGLDCFRRAAMECEVKNPEALLCSSLRERIASCWQLMSLSECELDRVSKMVGRTSKDCYTLSKDATQLEEVSKQLLKMGRTLSSSLLGTARDGTILKPALKRRPWSEREQAAVRRYLSEFLTKMKVPGKKECNACIAAEPDLVGRSWTDVKNYIHNTLQTARRRNNQQKPGEDASDLNPKSPAAGVQMSPKTDLGPADTCSVTTVLPNQISESSNRCTAMASQTNLRESMFPQEIPLGYGSLCSTTTNMIHPNQPLMSTFTPSNATDTQVVPTFTPHNTTNALISTAYTENNRILPMAPTFTHSSTGMPPPSAYSLQDHINSPMLSSYSPLNVPSTSMVPTFTQLNPPSTSMVPTFSPLNDTSRMTSSSFTPLTHSSPPDYPTCQPRTSAQVVPTVLGPSLPNRGVAHESAPTSGGGKTETIVVKPQKRNKRLWSGEEQAAVRRQLGDFCKLIKVPGKKECDACLAAEPALSSRSWREVKYFVHNSIQSMKRRGHPVAPKEIEGHEQPETHNLNTDWDGPVYLSL